MAKSLIKDPGSLPHSNKQEWRINVGLVFEMEPKMLPVVKPKT